MVNAINAQNLILPSGTAKFGDTEYTVKMNGSPDAIAGLNDLPVKTVNGATTYLRDVAYVRDGFSPQTNIVRKDGARGVLLSVLKNGGASTLDIVANLRALLPRVQAILPGDVKVTPLFDQSVFVKAAVKGVVVEALIAAGLTALMVLLFLGNWRTTLIIALTIPLSILASILILQVLGETLNLMTLGGLALSVGILVDQAIVTIENIERHLHLGKALDDAIIVGAGEIGVPAFVSTLCICIVFVPMFFLSGVARFLFVPLAEAVVFAMVASYILSRTLVPTLVMLLMRGVHGAAPTNARAQPAAAHLPRLRPRSSSGCAAPTRSRWRRCSASAPASASPSSPSACVSCGLYPFLGRDFFPSVDAGQIRLHMRAPTGTRIEETARLADDVEAAIREYVPKDQLETVLDNLGVPNSGINLSYSNAGTIGTLDGEIQLSLQGRASADRRVRDRAAPRAAEALSRRRVLLPAGRHRHADPQLRPAGGDRRAVHRQRPDGQRRARRRAGEEDPADPRRRRRARAPALRRAVGSTCRWTARACSRWACRRRTSARTCWSSLSGSSQTAPAFWLNPQNGIVYSVAVQTPQYRVDSLDSLLNVPVTAGGRRPGADPAARQPGRGDSRRRSSPSPRATTSCRRSTSSPASRAPTWRASPRACNRSSTSCGRSCRAAARSCCAARCRR